MSKKRSAKNTYSKTEEPNTKNAAFVTLLLRLYTRSRVPLEYHFGGRSTRTRHSYPPDINLSTVLKVGLLALGIPESNLSTGLKVGLLAIGTRTRVQLEYRFEGRPYSQLVLVPEVTIK